MSEGVEPVKEKRKPAHAANANHAPAHAEEGEGSWLVSYADMMTLLVGFFVILLSFSKVDDEKFEEVKRETSKQFGGIYQVPFGTLADRLKAEISKAGLGDQFIIKQTDLGVEISFQGTVFFETGSADLKEKANELLGRLTPIIHSEAKDFSIIIEGHTDDVPIIASTRFKSNWELSSIRACRVLESFEAAGFLKSKMTAVGYGDARPIVPNRDDQGNAIAINQGQNRRVVIKVLKDSGSSLGVGEPAKSAPPEGS